MHNSFQISFKSRLENIGFARNTCAMFLSELNLTVSFIQEIKTIVSEAVTNSIIHGYEGDINKTVFINLSYDLEYIYLEIIDYGIGIPNIEEARTPLFTTKMESERSGLGFTIMEVFSDEFSCESLINKGTKIIIKKKFSN
jgi:stage II sporulation protein AB (anti-sigma F factor)